MLGNDGGQPWRLRRGLRHEQVGSQWLVLDVRGNEMLRLHGPAGEVLTRLAAGETTLPEHLDAAAGALFAKGVLEPAGPPPRGPRAWSRRRVLGLAAASAAAAGVAATVGIDSLVLPAAAQASSPDQFITTSGDGTESGTFEIEGVYYRTRTFVTGEQAGGTFTFSVTDLQSADSDRRTIEYFLVGGGGGGGGCSDRTGGGGAGATTFSGSYEFMTTGNLTVVVGGGGRGGNDGEGLAPEDGQDSTLSDVSGAEIARAFRGGRGGQDGQTPQVGGGAYHNGGSGSTRSPGGGGGSGFDGGAAANPPLTGQGNFAGGGGGGAEGNANAGNACQGLATPPGGQGGLGLESSITGIPVRYGGGGGGGFQRLNPAWQDGCGVNNDDDVPLIRAPGGSGGGGSGAGYIAGRPNGEGNSNLNGTDGTNGLGGGGGGAAASDTRGALGIAGNGGSGIVIIRYRVPAPG